MMTAEPETSESGASIPTITHDEKIPCGQNSNNPHHAAMQIVHRCSGLAAGIGLVPLPVVDMVAMVAVQIAMLRKLAAVYGVPFHEQRSKSAVATLIGSINASYLGGSLLKMVPVFGLVSLAAMPVVTGAITYAWGGYSSGILPPAEPSWISTPAVLTNITGKESRNRAKDVSTGGKLVKYTCKH
jgi:uncharacterized protein (DUF697 family)